MKDIHKRLRHLREDRGLSLREMAAKVGRDGGQKVSHDSVRSYEEGRSIPSDYLIAVCDAFHVSPGWLLFGRGSIRSRPALDASTALEAVADIVGAFRSEKEDWERDGWTGATLRRWHGFTGTLTPRDPVSKMSVESWRPPSGRGLGATGLPSAEEIRTRIATASSVVGPAGGHVAWLQLSLRDIDHVVALADREGVIVMASGNPTGVLGEWRMETGSDWSEEAMGRTAVAAALESDRLCAVVGTEDEAFHDFACVAAPVHDASGAIAGVLHLATRLPDACPPRLTAVAYVAGMIEREVITA